MTTFIWLGEMAAGAKGCTECSPLYLARDMLWRCRRLSDYGRGSCAAAVYGKKAFNVRFINSHPLITFRTCRL